LLKSTAVPPGIDNVEANQSDEAGARILKRTIVIAALLAAVIVVAAGIGFYFINASKSGSKTRDASIATFVVCRLSPGAS
jgi:hypothetical protein